MKHFLNIFLLFQTSYQLISTSANDTEYFAPDPFETSPDCIRKCPEEIPEWDKGAQCNLSEIGSCQCTYDDPYCFLECLDNFDGTGNWRMACAGGGDAPPAPSGDSDTSLDSETTSNDETFPPFETSPDCILTCPKEIPEWDKGAQCNKTEIGSCTCTYDDPYCFLECLKRDDETGIWVMACAGGGDVPPVEEENHKTTKITKKTKKRGGKSKKLKTSKKVKK